LASSTATRLIDETTKRFRRLDVVVRKAGFADRPPWSASFDRAAWTPRCGHYLRLLRARHRGPAWLVKAGVPMSHDTASPSFVAHAVARRHHSFSAASSAAQAGMEALAKAAAADLARPAFVNCVAQAYREVRLCPCRRAARSHAR